MDGRSLAQETLKRMFISRKWDKIVVKDFDNPKKMKQKEFVVIKLNRKQLDVLQNALDFEEDTADLHGNYQERNRIRRLSETIRKQLNNENK